MPKKFVLLLSIAILLIATLKPGGSIEGWIDLPYLDKLAHFVLFFFAAWNITHCYASHKRFILFLCLLLLLAPLTEIAQINIPRRGFEYMDIFSDVLGVVIAYFLYTPRLSQLYTLVVK